MTVESNVADFPVSFDTGHYRFMRNDGGELVFVDAQVDEGHDSAFRASYKRWQVFHRDGALPAEADVILLDMPQIWCPEKVAHVERLLHLFDSLQNFSNLSDNFGDFLVLGRIYDKLPFLHERLK